MDDVFYFTDRGVTLGEVAELSATFGYELVSVSAKGLVLRMDSTGQELHVAPYDLGEGEPDEENELRSLGVQSAFCISHHRAAIQGLTLFLARVLGKFGGWIGNDADGFHPRFDEATLREFRYPE